MRYTLPLNDEMKLSFYYNDKIYDPHFSSIELAMIANTYIYGPIRLLDIATGSGFTGLILKKIHPELDVTLTDADPEAVRIANLNAKRMGLNVTTKVADLIPDDGKHYPIITANLPTYDEKQMAEEKIHGPDEAYYGGRYGLELYRRLLQTAVLRCDILCCEVQKKRQEQFISLAELSGWKIIARSEMSFALTSS